MNKNIYNREELFIIRKLLLLVKYCIYYVFFWSLILVWLKDGKVLRMYYKVFVGGFFMLNCN